jgi:hypothetical protein
MAVIIADRESILELLKPERDGSANAWQQEFSYLSAHRLFVEESEYPGGRQAMRQRVVKAGGPLPANANTRFSLITTIDDDRFDVLEFADLQDELTAAGYWIELLDWPAFLRLTDAAYDNQVPDFVPGYRTPVYDAEGNQTGWEPVTWDNWKGENQTHLTSDQTGDGYNYIPMWSGNNGTHLALSVLKQIIDAGGYIRGLNQWPQFEE